MSKKIKIPKANKGYGYCGAWKCEKGTPKIGWVCPPYIFGKIDRKYPQSANVSENPHMKNERFFLCEIIIKPLKDKKGRPITKLIK